MAIDMSYIPVARNALQRGFVVMDARCPVVVAQYSIHRWRIASGDPPLKIGPRSSGLICCSETLPIGSRGPHRASVLSGERLDDHLAGCRRFDPGLPLRLFNPALTPPTVPRPLLVPLWCRLKIARARRQVPPNHVLIKSYAEARPVGHFNPSMIDDRCLNPLFDQR
jgi:hypothetical protein